MKRTRHTPEQSVTKLREAEAMLAAGKTVGQVVQALGVSEQTFKRWRSGYGVVDADDPWFHFVYDDSWRIVATYRADHAGGGGGQPQPWDQSLRKARTSRVSVAPSSL
jgi:hypothetical protein